MTAHRSIVRGQAGQSGDHVVKGLYDALVESCKHLLQMTACQDQFTESGVVGFPRRPGLKEGRRSGVGLITEDVEGSQPSAASIRCALGLRFEERGLDLQRRETG